MRWFRSWGAGSQHPPSLVDNDPQEAHIGPPAHGEPPMPSQQPRRGAQQSLHYYCSTRECAGDI